MQKNNFLWNTIGITLNAFTSLFFLIIINRINGITEAGIFTYSFSIACLFYVLALYFNRVYQVSDVKKRFSNNQYITNRIITSTLVIIITIVFVLINKFDFYKSSIIILLTLYKVLEAISDCYHAFIQKEDQLYFVGKSLAYKAIIGVLGFFTIDVITSNLLISILWLIIVNTLGLIIEIHKYKKLCNEKYSLEFLNTITLFKVVLPLFIFSFLNIYINNSQKYILEYFMAEEFQTILGIIIMPATMLSLCGQYLMAPYLNNLSKYYSNREFSFFKKTFFNITVMFMVLNLLVLLIAFFLGIPVLNIIYGINLNQYKLAFMIIIIGAIFYALSTTISNMLVIMNKNREQLYLFIISSIITTISSILLIKNYEILGASISYLITMICHFILSFILYKVSMNQIKKEEV